MTTKAANTGNGYPSGMKNRIINGGMDISQRGTSFAISTNGTYTLDRWGWAGTITGAATVTQNSNVPSSNEFQNSYRYTVTTAEATMSASHISTIYQILEGYNIRDLIGRTFTLSFWVRSSKTGIHCVSFRPTGYDRSYIAEYNITVADTWQYKTITVAGGLTTEGTWNYTNGIGLAVCFCLASGSNGYTTAGSWNAGSTGFVCTSNQVNCLDTIGNIFAITGVQLELGPVATPFEHRLYGTELALCQRYYEIGTARWDGYATNGQNYSIGIYYNVLKRTAPTVAYANLSTVGMSTTPNIAGSYTNVNFVYHAATATQGANFVDTWTATAEL